MSTARTHFRMELSSQRCQPSASLPYAPPIKAILNTSITFIGQSLLSPLNLWRAQRKNTVNGWEAGRQDTHDRRNERTASCRWLPSRLGRSRAVPPEPCHSIAGGGIHSRGTATNQ